MDSIQVIRLLDVLRVNEIRNAIGVVPRSIIVKGKDFKNVEQVLINSFVAPEFVVYSTTELVAEVPEVVRDTPITDVAVLSSSLTLTDRSLVEFTFGTRPKKAKGILRLMQVFLRQLLRTPGSNIFHRRSGGGMLKRVGGVMNDKAAADVAIAVNNAKQYIIGAQTPERNIPPIERLLSAEISALTADPKSTALYVTVVLTSHSGVRGAATLSA
jgi:hypothetical protein